MKAYEKFEVENNYHRQIGNKINNNSTVISYIKEFKSTLNINLSLCELY